MSFTRLPFEAVFADESGGNVKTPQSEYLPAGSFPVVDQGKTLIGGYVNDASRLCGGGRPAIIFGDHTRCIKHVDFPFCMGADGVKVLRPKIAADLKYLYYYLQTISLPDGGYDRHYKYLKRTEIVIPPISEQHRIAAILDQADALRAKRREALAMLDELQRGIFIEMFGDPVTNPQRWPVESLGAVADFYAGNSLPEGVPFVGQEDGYLLMKVSDMNLVGNERLVEKCQLWSEVSGARSATCPTKSIVLPKRGGAIGTNKKRMTVRATVLDPNLMAVFAKGSILPDYLFQWFMGFDLSSIASGSSVPQLNKQDLSPLEIQIPPLELQKKFSERCRKLEVLKSDTKTSLKWTERLFSSLQHRAFRGEL